MTIRPRPEPKQDPKDTGLYEFIETHLEWNDSCCESVKTVYEKYKNYETVKRVNKASKLYFIRYVIGHFAAKGKEVKHFSCLNEDWKKEDIYFSNIRLVQFDPDEKTAATLDAINAGKAPDDPPAVRSPCGECADPDCGNCQIRGGTPIKLYDPEEAAAAMLAGRILLNSKKEKCLWKVWENGEGRFCIEDDRKRYAILSDFSGLYEEARYV
jgi:hypothetical protein